MSINTAEAQQLKKDALNHLKQVRLELEDKQARNPYLQRRTAPDQIVFIEELQRDHPEIFSYLEKTGRHAELAVDTFGRFFNSFLIPDIGRYLRVTGKGLYEGRWETFDGDAFRVPKKVNQQYLDACQETGSNRWVADTLTQSNPKRIINLIERAINS